MIPAPAEVSTYFSSNSFPTKPAGRFQLVTGNVDQYPGPHLLKMDTFTKIIPAYQYRGQNQLFP